MTITAVLTRSRDQSFVYIDFDIVRDLVNMLLNLADRRDSVEWCAYLLKLFCLVIQLHLDMAVIANCV